MELKKGSKVNLTIGSQATVIKELGRGGQGIVYLVELGGQQMALKWYLTPPEDKFYKNLERNITAGAPSDAFIWPEYLTKKENGSYGYIMKLRPNDYFEFGNYLLARKNFKSFNAMMAAAMKICDGFMMLHRFGYSYQDLNDGNFFIRPTDGDVLICDNDNVTAQGEKSGIMGKARYMAPEVVAGGVPDKYSDRFSLSVILFMLFFANHPFEGAKVVACPCMTEKFEKEFNCEVKVDVFDSNEAMYAKLKAAREHLDHLIREGETKLDYLNSVLALIGEAESEKDLADLRRELVETGIIRQGKSKKPDRGRAQAPLRFRSEDGFEILVGRSNLQNDELTTKLGRRTDYWLHTQKIHGAHVILWTEGTEPDGQSVREAAQLAAWFSQGKEGKKASW